MKKYLVLVWSLLVFCMVMALVRGCADPSIWLFPAFGLGWTMVELRCYSLLHRKNH